MTSQRGPIVIDTDIYGADLVANAPLADQYEPVIVGRPRSCLSRRSPKLRYGALHRNWGEARRRKLDAKITPAEVVHSGEDLVGIYARLRADCVRVGDALGHSVAASDKVTVVKPEVEAALGRAAEFRRELLGQLSTYDRVRLLEDLFVDFFVVQWRVLLKWAALTGQSSQVDTGYIAQHVASILLAEPGQGFRGKGLDLLDGTEVKSAAIISGVDRPRWNHNLGTLAQDAKRVEAAKPTTSQEYLASPTVFYLLFDRVVDPGQPDLPLILRVRGWCLDGPADDAWRDLVTRYVETRTPGKYNLQLHPPVGYDDDIVVNTLGNLDFGDVKVLEARIHGLGPDEEFYVEWVMRPPDELRPTPGRSRALPYVKNARPSRLASAAEVLPDTGTLRELLPDHDVDALVRILQIEVRIEEIEEIEEVLEDGV